MNKIKGKVNVIFASPDGWLMGNRPNVESVVADDGRLLTEDQKNRAIKQTLYPDGGIDWMAWRVGESDSFGFYISK